MKKNETNIQIDKLKLCFLAPVSELRYLQETTTSLFVENYKLKPSMDTRFDYCYDVFETNNGELLFNKDEIGDRCSWGIDQKEELPIGQIKFSFNRDRNMDSVYLIFHIYNHILYSDRLAEAVKLPFLLADNIKFNNYSSLDIALDTKKNIPGLIKKMLRDKTTTTILNRKVVGDRNEIIRGVFFEYSTTLNKLKYPSVTLKQKMAYKDEGVVIQAYNKKAEIENHSGKFYILDYYENPKKLFRLEVRLPYKSIKDYLSKKGMEADLKLIFDKKRLLELFLYYLNSVICFRVNSRRKIPWTDLLNLHSEDI